MDLDSAVKFSVSTNWGQDGDIKKLIDDFRLKTQKMGFYDERMAYNNYHEDMEEELKAAYAETTKLEKEMRQLFTITDVLAEKIDEYEYNIANMKNEKDSAYAESGYMKENLEMLLEKENEKDCEFYFL